MASSKGKLISPISVPRIVENIFACKWSLSVLSGIRNGVYRPGALQRAIGGISIKVLNQRLAKMVRCGLLSKHNFGEIPPRVEYRLTSLGGKLVAILDQVDELQRDLEREAGSRKRSGSRIGSHERRAKS